GGKVRGIRSVTLNLPANGYFSTSSIQTCECASIKPGSSSSGDAASRRPQARAAAPAAVHCTKPRRELGSLSKFIFLSSLQVGSRASLTKSDSSYSATAGAFQSDGSVLSASK